MHALIHIYLHTDVCMNFVYAFICVIVEHVCIFKHVCTLKSIEHKIAYVCKYVLIK